MSTLDLVKPDFLGRLLYRFAPVRRRVVLENLRRAFGGTMSDREIVRLAQAFYGHFGRVLCECFTLPFLGARRRRSLVRVENTEAILAASRRGKGVLVLTGHFGNWEVAPVLGLGAFPEYRGRFHILRRPIRAGWLEKLVSRRFRRAGIGVIPKSGSLDAILELLARGDAVVFVLDQHAGRKEGVAVEFFGHRASTFRSLAVIQLSTGAPVVPAHCWREEDGGHVLRFEEALPPIAGADPAEAIKTSTQAYNRELERLIKLHPEQWFWLHRRWKDPRPRR